MNTSIAYEIVEDTSPIAFYKPTRVLINLNQYQMLVHAGFLTTLSDDAVKKVIGGITKGKLQYHAARLAADLRKLTKHVEDLPITKDSSVAINLGGA